MSDKEGIDINESQIQDGSKPPLKPPPLLDFGPPKAVITQVARFTYEVRITVGLGGYEFFVLGRKRAERKARRWLRKGELEHRRWNNSWEIT